MARALGGPVAVETVEPVPGGCIHEGFRLRVRGGDAWFLKCNASRCRAMFDAEADALRLLGGAGGLRVPRPLTAGADAHHAWLVMEWLDLTPLDARGLRALGRGLAALHATTGPRFGGPRSNWLGTTVQDNAWCDDWVGFWSERRLGPQLRLAARQPGGAAVAEAGARLQSRLPAFFAGHRPRPSLLHGDLWSGNAACLRDGTATVFDPAPYYGDAETDLAMTELFGGFGPAFLAGYDEVAPVDSGYAVRRDLYNLYHVLNHFNLFGGSYGSRALLLARRLLAEA